MNMPEFTAETSLYKSSRHYQQQSIVHSESLGRDILPALPDLGSLEPHLFPLGCSPLLKQEFWYPKSCITVDGVLGTKDCYQICDIYYRWSPWMIFFGGSPCQYDHSECAPEVCGTCHPLFDL